MKCFVSGLVIILLILRPSVARDFATPSGMANAPTWQQRQDALHSVLRRHQITEKELQDGIIRLFNRETDDPQSYKTADEDDRFAWYYEEVSDLCQQIATTTHRQDAWRSLTYSTYNPTSKFGRWLASRPDAFPFFVEMYQSSRFPASCSRHGDAGRKYSNTAKVLGWLARWRSLRNVHKFLLTSDETL